MSGSLTAEAETASGRAPEPDGCKRLEVEFPPLTAQGFDANFKSSDEYIDTNVQLAISAAKKLRDAGWKRIHVIVPDKGEFNRSYRMFRGAIENTEGVVTMGALVLWNLELDTLRSDLGLFGFPSKDLQYRFLSTFKPVFYIRPREYSKSIAAPPYVVNYSGCLFRSYPGPWQCMLNESGGQMVSVAERQERFNLGELKEELLTAMGLNTEAPGSALSFLRRGYKTSTWWEDARDKEQYGDWRT
ncbi:hypothetical protein WJX73_008906 [Symbiochloris irregularis]|uniref:DUF1995 domain-containing protein n=1 Tax=Symbiochloris irregularis TaxID=706552 RepID=A0AAW1PNZ0_9CHLO